MSRTSDAGKPITVFAASKIILRIAREALPTRRNHRDLPLWMWLQSTGTTTGSRIERLTARDGFGVAWGWVSWGAAANATGYRIAQRCRLTYVQLACLQAWLDRRYRGRANPQFMVACGVVPDPQTSDRAAMESFQYFREAVERAGYHSAVELPLRVLLSPEITALILSFQLRRVLK